MLYFFVRGIVHDRFYFRKRDVWHLAPFLFHFLANLPFILKPFEFQHETAEVFIQNFDLFKEYRLSFYPIAWNNTARTIQMLAYIIASLSLLRITKYRAVRMKGQLKFQYVYTRKRITFILLLVMVISVLSVVNDAIYVFNDLTNAKTIEVSIFILHLMMYVYCIIPLYVILNPKFLYGLPHLETHYIISSTQKLPPDDNAESE
ncbi:hypothetical protein MASR2M117_08090 [Paludibacter sp.]